ncbi:ATP-dependent helicase [Ligilactobacillus salitolerans]|uniref:ATP-dependent helicase n=1 Tax=Ligilactobacillus salitolerans TaxID=1808352 RepID=A0A401IS31_9LACO|nr:ATP-dependent DNA helicase [Ligilactobacillus salitolerans]GBG94338.1 ATP-dependent helicase [Ligilactobacillus salitolerans]
MNQNSIGIRQMVEFILRGGDLNPATARSQNTAQEGARIHRKLQKDWEQSCKSEVYLKKNFQVADNEWTIHGRADAIHQVDEVYDEIREIKTSTLAYEELSQNTLTLYFGQAKVYAHILMEQNDLDELKLSLYYFQTSTEQLTIKSINYTREQAAEFFTELTAEFAWWIEFKAQLRTKRNASCHKLSFPFNEYRKNQHQLAGAVYKSIHLHKRLFVEAPTGTGKTISTLFPAVKALGEKEAERIFYLTAKQSTRKVAEEAGQLMEEKGAILKAVTLTAKDKIVFPEEKDVADTENPYFLGYYDRLKPALKDILANETLMSRAVIETYARKHNIDPFEFSLDVSLFCDLIICDYNYLFDPQVYLQRFFTDKDEANIFLIDEAHNLADRARSMYTKEVSSNHLANLLSSCQAQPKATARLTKKLEKLATQFETLKDPLRNYQQESLIIEEELDGLTQKLTQLTDYLSTWLQENPESSLHDEVLDFFFECRSYLKISEFYGPEFRTRLQYDSAAKSLRVKIFCLDPSRLVDQQLKLGGSSILFSATLSPLGYYQEILGGEKNSLAYQLPSPFAPEKLAVITTQYIQTTYRKREANQAKVLGAIHELTQAKIGNYLVFLPSYSYLKQICLAYQEQYPGEKVIWQENEMDANAREQFLTTFTAHPTESLVGFAILGGIFSEGIDLKGERLSGTAIISVGLPPSDPELDALKDYYTAQGKDGFQYAYQLPGVNNIFQAAGRVIRGQHDTGVVLLLDERFTQTRYTRFYPAHWQNYQILHDQNELTSTLHGFWQTQEKKQQLSEH